MCCVRFVNLRNLQNALRNLEIVHAQVANFWPKPDPSHNPNPSQIVQRILHIVKTHKLGAQLATLCLVKVLTKDKVAKCVS